MPLTAKLKDIRRRRVFYISVAYAAPLPDSDANFIIGPSSTFSREGSSYCTLARHLRYHAAKKKFP